MHGSTFWYVMNGNIHFEWLVTNYDGYYEPLRVESLVITARGE